MTTEESVSPFHGVRYSNEKKNKIIATATLVLALTFNVVEDEV